MALRWVLGGSQGRSRVLAVLWEPAPITALGPACGGFAGLEGFGSTHARVRTGDPLKAKTRVRFPPEPPSAIRMCFMIPRAARVKDEADL
jgi:hypothetical protein